jgi:cell division protein FtsI (penicillin-binding protein 3)
MPGMLAQSCNVCAGQTAGEVGKTYYHDFLVQCGIGSEPQSGLPGETPGLLAKLKKIRPRDLASMGFGQAVNCSALQLTSIVGGLVNDGVLVPPHILAAVRDADDRPFWEYKPPTGTRLCRSEVSQQLRDMLEGVVVRGTGKPAAIPGVRVGGKTGTAQQVDPKTGKHLQNRFIVSFISVLPIEKPRYIIHVECAEPKHGLHGSDVAAPVCQRLGKFIMERVAPLRAMEQQNNAAKPPAGKVKKP